MKRLYIGAFLLGVPVIMGLSIWMAFFTDVPEAPLVSPIKSTSGAQIYAALPDNSGLGTATIQARDGRVKILERYFESFNSPLVDHAETFVEAADEYNLDFRLVAAISRQESNGCKYIPPESYNCWGWGIHKRGTLHFESYDQGIWTVSKGLREKYVDDGLITPELIMSRYTPSSPGTWSAAVRQFMEEME